MKKFKTVLAGIITIATAISCLAVPANAGTVSLSRGQAAGVTSVIGAGNVRYYGECSSSSGSSVVFTLRRSFSTSTSIVVASHTVTRGNRFPEQRLPGYDPLTMWQYTVSPIDPRNLVGVASGYAYAYEA